MQLQHSEQRTKHSVVTSRNLLDMADVKLIFDTGAYETRVGLSMAGDSPAPSLCFPSIVGRPTFPLGGGETFFAGHEALKRRGILEMNDLVVGGSVQRWDDMEEVWEFAFNELQVASVDCTLLVTDLYNHNAAQRKKAIEVLFGKLHVNRLYIGNQQVLSLYGTGRITGCIVDSGHTTTTVVPVYEGYRIASVSRQIPVGGTNVDAELSQLAGLTTCTSAGKETVRFVKENAAFASLDLHSQRHHSQSHLCTLPDGTIVDPGAAAFQCVENVLFRATEGVPSVPDLTATTIQACEIDLRRSLYNNIVLAGGNTMIKGFEHRLRSDLSEMVPAGVEVNVIAKEQRQNLAWVGGTILSQLSEFDSHFVPRQVYDESGVDACVRSLF